MKKHLLVFLLLFIFFTIGNSAATVKAVEPEQGSMGMVSSAHPIATHAGLAILEQGGNAFDAAVAVVSTLNVVEPMMSGVGGYGTILIYDAGNNQFRFLDSSGKIPVNTRPDMFRKSTPDYEANRKGPKAVSTPGNVNAWQAMSKTYGKLKWAQLFDSAIKAAEQGFVPHKKAIGWISRAYSSFPEHARKFYGNDGRPLKEGERLVQKDLGKTLRLIARHGVKVLYGGPLGKKIHEAMRKSGGFLSLKDLQDDKAEWWEPISIQYRDCRVYTASPPSTAFPSLIRLGIMSRFDLKKSGHNSLDTLHRFSEVTKHAFRCRLKYAGDPEVKPPPLKMLLSETYWQKQADLIDMKKAKPFTYPGPVPTPSKHTTHFVVADSWGNIVSATQTLGNLFGSRIMPEGTGIWLNNSLAYCTFEPAGNPMDAHPGRRKLSGDCPTIIVRNGKPWAALGTPGGHTIGQTVPQMVMNLIDFDMNIAHAIAAPRISFIEPDIIAIERGISETIRDTLVSFGHNARMIPEPFGLGNAHGLTLHYDKNGKAVRFTGASDPRGNGLAKGLSSKKRN